MRTVSLLVLAIVTIPTHAAVAGSPYETGVELFDASYFDKAATAFEHALAGPLTAERTRRAHLLLAECYHLDHREAEARAQIKSLLALAPKTVVTSDTAPPAFVALFDDVKRETLRPEPPRAVPPEAHKTPPRHIADGPLRPSDPASLPDTLQAPALVLQHTPRARGAEPWYVRLWPLGIGHLLNGDTAAGAGLMASELVLIGGNIGITVYNFSQRDAQGGFPRTSAYPALYWAELGSGIAAYALVAFDVLDALLWSPDRVAARKMVVVVPTANGGAEVRFAVEWK